MVLSLLLLFFEMALMVFLGGISVHDIRQHIIKNSVLLWMLPFAAGRAVVNSIIAISGGAVWYHPILSHIGGGIFAFLLFLIVAMILGRIAWGGSMTVLLSMRDNTFTFAAFMAGAILNAIPGIILQLLLIPAIMSTLHVTGLQRFRGRPVKEDKL